MNPFDDETTQKYSDAMEQLKQMNFNTDTGKAPADTGKIPVDT